MGNVSLNTVVDCGGWLVCPLSFAVVGVGVGWVGFVVMSVFSGNWDFLHRWEFEIRDYRSRSVGDAEDGGVGDLRVGHWGSLDAAVHDLSH